MTILGPTTALSAIPEQCAAITDDSARLACDDDVFRPVDAGETADASPEARVPPPDRAASAPPSDSAATLGAEDLSRRVSTDDAPAQSVEARIASIDVMAYGRLIFELDNGQAWRQIEADGRHFSVGAQVTVRRAGLSGYRLIAANGVSTRVSRIR